MHTQITLQLVGIAGKPGLVVKPQRYPKKRLSQSATGGSECYAFWLAGTDDELSKVPEFISSVIAAVCIVVFFSLSVCYCQQRDSAAGWFNRMNRKQRRAAAAQMAMVNPLAPPPTMPILAPPVFGPPRHAEVYAKPFFRGSANQEQAKAMIMDPVFQAYPIQPEQFPNGFGENQGRVNGGFFSKIRGLLGRGNQTRLNETAEWESHADHGHHHLDQDHGPHHHGHGPHHHGHGHHHHDHGHHPGHNHYHQTQASEAGYTDQTNQRYDNWGHVHPSQRPLDHFISPSGEPYPHHGQMTAYDHPAYHPPHQVPGAAMNYAVPFFHQPGQAYPYPRGQM